MSGKRRLVHTAALFTAPLLVAWLGFSVAGAIGLVILLLLWRWAITLSGWVAPAKSPELILDTISASHFVEKVRWCMDRLDLTYTERPAGGTLSAFYLGHSVPRLRFRTGAVQSSIGNSAEILRYLWGRYAADKAHDARFLEPTAERLELESRIDRCGVALQVWVYHHILDDRDLTLHAWGCNSPVIPAWQRFFLRLVFPLQRLLIRKSFRISPTHYQRSVERVSTLLEEVEQALEDGRRSILGGELNFSDLAFASIMGLWLQPTGYGGGKADTVRLEESQLPEGMRSDVEHWKRRYPRSTEFIESLYAQRGGARV